MGHWPAHVHDLHEYSDMWEDNFSQPLTSLLKQLQCKKNKQVEKSIFHFCRKLQGTSDRCWKGPKIRPVGTHQKSNLPVQYTHHNGLWGQVSLWLPYQPLHQFNWLWFPLKESPKPHLYHYWHQTVTQTPTHVTPALIIHRDYNSPFKKP